MTDTTHPVEQTTKQPAGNKTKPLALLAEDDDEMRALLSRELEDAGYAVAEARHGLDLLLHLAEPSSKPALQDIDLIVSDLRMPGLTGLEALEAVNPEVRLPPIVVITAFGDAATHADARRHGATVVLDKPFDLDEFIAHVKRLVPPGGPLPIPMEA